MDRAFAKEKNQSILPTKPEAMSKPTTLAQNKRKAPDCCGNHMPHGMNLNEHGGKFRDGKFDGADSAFVTEDIRKGYRRVKISSTDELPSDAQAVQFYTDVSTDEYNGFIERQNVCDRM